MGGMPLENASPAMALPGPRQNKGSAITIGGSETESKPKKICCACPNTKRLRDECIVEHGETACTKWIEAHRQCLRAEGFSVLVLLLVRNFEVLTSNDRLCCLQDIINLKDVTIVSTLKWKELSSVLHIDGVGNSTNSVAFQPRFTL